MITPNKSSDPGIDAVITRRELMTADVVALTMTRADGGLLPAWEPGAHIDLILPNGLIRQYSLCSDPADRQQLRIAVLREANGRGGSALIHRELDEATRVRVGGPRNHFPLTRDAAQYVFIAGGIGITPFLPMINAVHARNADWRLVYGGRSRASMAFAEKLSTQFPCRVQIIPQDEAGLIDLPTCLGDPQPATAVYCCGPTGLIDAVEQYCLSTWPVGTLHVERFSPKPVESALQEAFEVELARTGTVLTVPCDRSLLHVLSAAGVAIDYSCEEGICGTCQIPVLAGTPDHRDAVLTDDERAAGTAVIACVPRAQSPRLVLDV